MAERVYGQREYMIALAKVWGYNRDKIVAKYARAEQDGKVIRWNKNRHISAERYANRLYSDGLTKGWLYSWMKKECTIVVGIQH